MKGWYASAREMMQCPVPGCGHVGTIITNIHCKSKHTLSRQEIEEAYGTPKRLPLNRKRGRPQND